MGRINDLKYHNDIVKKTNKTGSYKYRIERYQAVNRFINALGATRQVPAKWYSLDKNDIIRVVALWRKQNKKDNTIEKYLYHLKSFLNVINHQVSGIDSHSLGLYTNTPNTNYSINDEIIDNISDPVIKNILLLQTKFGLTFAEAIRFIPDIHTNQDGLWLTREITRNSLDRAIKYQNDTQREIIKELSTQLGNCESAQSCFGYETIRVLYQFGLKKVGLKSSINYRAIYAKERFNFLTKQIDKKLARQKVMEEMDISSATLRRFLNESE